MKRAESGDRKANRQCWECLKRRLVCDHTLPHCKKCVKNGKECPGYDEQKPLQWIEPGKVTSRRRKKNSPPKVYTIRPRDPQPVAPTISDLSLAPIAPSLPVIGSAESSSSDSSETITFDDSPTLEWPIFDEPQITPEALELYKSVLANSLIQEENATWWNSLTAEEQTEHITMMATEHAGGSSAAGRIMQIGSQRKLKEVVQRGQYWEAAVLIQSERRPLERLQRLLWIMEWNQLPSYEHLSNDTCEVVQAVNYCKFILSHKMR